MSRKEFCVKDGILITYDNATVCFEDITTAESILLKNNGEIVHSNFDSTQNEYYQNYLKKIYSAITACRNLDGLESA
ncbi:MAG: hypothetical protein IAA96_06050 [Spirochaetes bacterium]|uniref:Uncharacterized protein n=1 Tax=Candidatus Avitreponema avistercoris TaxID=2840705 RepID=A0A9D9EM71_9SPIR|nr:hypothetical protein [Candidatus Avitreponema avistercoris]